MIPDEKCSRASSIAGVLVAIGVVVYAVLFTSTCFSKFANFRYVDFDLSVHAQSVWNILHGSLDSSILGVPFLGNHMVPILFLLAPFCTVLDPARSLLLIQSVVLATGAWGLFLIGRRVLPLPWAVGWAFLYLVYPPLWYMNLYEFHPVALAGPGLIFAFYFYQQQRFRPFAVFLALSMLCQENIALIVAGFGVLALVQRRKGRWIWGPLVVGILYFVLAAAVIMPRLNQGRILFGLLYAHLGSSPGAAVVNILCHPLRTAAVVVHPNKLAFLASLLFPVGFLALLNPATFVPLLPVLAQRLLSARATETSILFHYQAEFIPFIFVASMEAVRRLLAWKGVAASRVLAAVLIAAAGLAVSRSNIVDFMVINRNADSNLSPTLAARRQALRAIPTDARVIATFRYLPSLAGRRYLYSLHHVYHGAFTLSTIPYPMPTDLDYIVLDALDPLTFQTSGFYGPDKYRNLQALMAQSSWDVVEQRDGFLVLRRSSGGAPPGYPLLEVREPDSVIPAHKQVQLDGGRGDVQVVGFDLGETDGPRGLPITLYWTKPAGTANDYDVLLELQDGKHTYWKRIVPGNRVWPPQSWPAGKWILDRQRIYVDGLVAPLREPVLKVHLRPFPGTTPK